MENILLPLLMIVVFCGLTAGQCPTIITRAQWGARKAKSSERLSVSPPTHVIIHHTSGLSCLTLASCIKRVRQIQNKHMDQNKWDDIGYNFLIGGDGAVYEGRGWGKKGAHCPDFNPKSLGIAYIGNFALRLPTKAARDAGKKLISCSVTRGYLVKIYKLGGHRQAKNANTQCPGLIFYNHIKTWPGYSSKL